MKKTYVKVTARGVEGSYIFPYDPDTFYQEINAVLARLQATSIQFQDGDIWSEGVEMDEAEYQAIQATYPQWPEGFAIGGQER